MFGMSHHILSGDQSLLAMATSTYNWSIDSFFVLGFIVAYCFI